MPSWICESCGQPAENEWEHTDPDDCIVALLERVDELETSLRELNTAHAWRDESEAEERRVYLTYNTNGDSRYARTIAKVGYKYRGRWFLIGADRRVEMDVTHFCPLPDRPVDYRTLPVIGE